jgi:hypothetical protein
MRPAHGGDACSSGSGEWLSDRAEREVSLTSTAGEIDKTPEGYRFSPEAEAALHFTRSQSSPG